MRILAPVSAPDEVEMLVESGADELYCGLRLRDWTARFGSAAALNRRGSTNANLDGWSQLRRVVERARSHGCAVHLTLNARSYTQEQVRHLQTLVGRAVDEIGVAGLIVADTGLLCALAEWRDDLPLHVSSLAAVHNVQAVRFFRDLGARRVIAPRQVTVPEVGGWVEAVPELEFEVFVLNDGCIFEEGHCSTLHGAGPICLTDWSREERRVPGRPTSVLPGRASWKRNVEAYREWSGLHVGSGGTTTPTGVPAGPCGLCAIPELLENGVQSLKIVGREAPPYHKLLSVRQVRHVLDLASAGSSHSSCRESARNIRGTPRLCDSGFGCYYPDVARRPLPDGAKGQTGP